MQFHTKAFEAQIYSVETSSNDNLEVGRPHDYSQQLNYTTKAPNKKLSNQNTVLSVASLRSKKSSQRSKTSEKNRSIRSVRSPAEVLVLQFNMTSMSFKEIDGKA